MGVSTSENIGPVLCYSSAYYESHAAPVHAGLESLLLREQLRLEASFAMAIPNRGPELLAVNIAFVCTAILACALRCFVRVRMVKAFGRDDWLMVLATVCIIMLKNI